MKNLNTKQEIESGKYMSILQGSEDGSSILKLMESTETDASFVAKEDGMSYLAYHSPRPTSPGWLKGKKDIMHAKTKPGALYLLCGKGIKLSDKIIISSRIMYSNGSRVY